MIPDQKYRPTIEAETLVRLVRRHLEIEVLYLFGSHAEGRSNKLSDIDLGVLLSRSVPVEDYLDLRRRYNYLFADALKTDRVEVVVLNEAPSHLAFQIVAPRCILFERDPLYRVQFETEVTNRFLDFRPFLEIREGYVKRQLSQGDFFG